MIKTIAIAFLVGVLFGWIGYAYLGPEKIKNEIGKVKAKNGGTNTVKWFENED